MGGRGRECVSKRCTQWVSRVEKRGSACCFRRQPPLFLGLSATLGVVESFRERGERASERERECERDGDRGRWAGVGVWVGRDFGTYLFFSFFLGASCWTGAGTGDMERCLGKELKTQAQTQP